jgi:cation transport ATPase
VLGGAASCGAVGHGDRPWQLVGFVTFEDTLLSDAAEFVTGCEESGVAVMIASGDARTIVATVADAVLP